MLESSLCGYYANTTLYCLIPSPFPQLQTLHTLYLLRLWLCILFVALNVHIIPTYKHLKKKSSPEDIFFSLLLEREQGGREGRERETLMWETLVGCFPYMPQQGINPATMVCVLTWNRTRNLLVYRMALQPTESHQTAWHFDSWRKLNSEPLNL